MFKHLILFVSLNRKIKDMEKTTLHKANTRGQADHGWLNARHSFSFAGYNDPARVHFGVLRVLNDDIVAPGQGFGRHPHDNMEIITIPLEGALEHQDSMGHKEVIQSGDIQVMSAGTGITHSEYNASKADYVKLLQIWVFPKLHNVAPRYGQATFKKEDRINKLQQIVSPGPADHGMWIHQDAWFHLGSLEKGFQTEYKLKKAGNGVYAFVIEGDVTINGISLNKRDGLGMSDTDRLSITAESNAELLLMEVPMEL
jgi:redox-sensitive bicupin YhaK (pirin superfamily)